MKYRREYHRSLSKHKMKDSRYKVRGKTHKRNGGDVQADLVRRRQQQHRWNHRQAKPQQPGSPAGGHIRFGRRVRGGRKSGSAMGGIGPRAHAAQNCEKNEADRPNPRQQPSRQKPFKNRRKGDKGQQRPDIRKGVKPIGRTALMRSAEPALQQRSCGGQDKKRGSHRRRQHQHDSRDRLLRPRGFQHLTRDNRQRRAGRAKSTKVQHSLAPRAQPACRQMRVGVAPEEQHLEKQHAGGPHAGHAAEPRENEFPDQRLHLKQQKGAQKNGQRIDQEHSARTVRGGDGASFHGGGGGGGRCQRLIDWAHGCHRDSIAECSSA